MAALASIGSAFAQSTVTLYGIADVAYVNKTHTLGNGTTQSKTSGVGEGFNAGNRIGFRGTEDLGGGLRAGFVIEQGINLTNGQLFSTRAAASGQQVDGYGAASGNMPTGAYSTSTNRQSFVSLGGGFGEIRAGFQYTPLYTVSTLSGFHVASEQPGGDLAHGTLANASFGGTRANGITYISPRMSGVQVTLQKGAGSGREEVEIAGTAAANGRAVDKNNRLGMVVNYTDGPLSASYAYTQMKIEQSAIPAAGNPTTIFGSASATAFSSLAAVNQKNKLHQFGGSYQLGGLKLVGSYAKGEVTDTVTAASNVDTKALQVGAEYALGAFRPFATTGTATVETTAGVKTFDAKSTQVGVRYDLSKRTVAYVMTGQVKDDAAAATALAKRKATAIGVAHSF